MNEESNNSDLAVSIGVTPANDEDTGPPEAAVPDGNTALGSDPGVAWRMQLDLHRRRVEELQENYDQSYLEIGKELVEARNIFKGHGDWTKWLKRNVPFSVRHAQRLIRVAEMFADTNLVSKLRLTSSKAFILARVGKHDIAYFCETFFPIGCKKKLVCQMTKRELELVVRNFLKAKLVSKDREEIPSGQEKETPKPSVSVESEFAALKEALNRMIASIKVVDPDSRNSWVSELENLYQTGLEQLAVVSE